MHMEWQMIESGSLSPEAIMAKDAHLLETLDPSGPCLLHLYDWSAPCLTFGYFTKPGHHLHLETMHGMKLLAARRPTGGGIIFHLTDFAFSVLIPASHPSFSLNPLVNYAYVNRKAGDAAVRLSSDSIEPQFFEQKTALSSEKRSPFCMAGPTQYDLIVGEKR